jgi:peptidoglycan/xylan/chitin deacetylase (PgdA/CDA1 family)
MTHDQLVELIQSNLVEIGAHTQDHFNLAYESGESLVYQIAQSKKDLEEEFSMPVESFAYPFGAMSTQAIQEVKNAGYTNAVSVEPGTHQAYDHMFTLLRIRPGALHVGSIANILNSYLN